ncbi:hypothetical protein ACQ86G_18280 [Roseateles chitinivorans]|uniref:hypothetical protein n=1 Tax=Roseateles chitinivorans TaxID=2917965 RepID=UPI003D67B495
MAHLELNAPIISGQSAAGFQLGMNVGDIEPLLTTAVRSPDLPRPINAQLATGNTFVVVDADDQIRQVFFGEHVTLAFNARGRLYCISLSGKYLGTYLGKHGIGTPMKDLQEQHPLDYDEGDEMNYPEAQLACGISFGGSCCPLEDDPEQTIVCMTVHDWSHQ